MTSVRLVRPVLLTAVSARAGLIVERFQRAIGHDVDPLHAVRLLNGADDCGRLAVVTPEELERELLTLSQRSPRHQQVIDWGVHWLVVGCLEGDTNVTPPVARTTIEEIVPVAARLKHNGFPFRLTLLLADASTGLESPFKPALESVATACRDAGIYTEIQVYLVRSQLAGGGSLAPSELDDLVELACQALVLTNVQPIDQSATNTLSSAQVARPADVVDGDPNRIFGRIGVQVIRSRRHDHASRCAVDHLRRFAGQHVAGVSSAEFGWAAPEIPITHPNTRLESILNYEHQPASRLHTVPAIWADQDRELERVEREAERWIVDLRDERRRMRSRLEPAVRDLRRASTIERARARRTIEEHAIRIWSNQDVEQPIPHIEEWIVRQRRAWGREAATATADHSKVRRVSDPIARATIDRAIDDLRRQVARRPNVPLMLVLSAIVAITAGLLVWTALSQAPVLAERATWLGGTTADRLQQARVPVVTIVILVITLVAVVSLAQLRQDRRRAWKRFADYLDEVRHQQHIAARAEAKLIEDAVGVKTIATATRHLYRLESRLHSIARQLRHTAMSPTVATPAATTLVHYIPGDGHPSGDDIYPCEVVRAAEANAILRTPATAESWVKEDAASWSSAAIASIEREYLTRWDERGSDPRLVLERALASFPGDVKSHLSHANRNSYHQRMLFGAGALGRLARDVTALEVIVYASDRDEVLCCEVQMGLDPASAAG